MLVLNVQLQVEQMAGLDLGGATVGTLQVCFQGYLVEILDFHSQTFVVNLLEHNIEDEEEDLIGVVLCVTSNAVPLQAVEKASVGGQERTITFHSGKNPPQVQGDVVVLLPYTGSFPLV